MKRIVRDSVNTLAFPVRSMKRFLEEPRSARRSAQAVLAVGILYALSSVSLAAAGAVPLAPPFLRLRAENYYFWQMFLVVPVILLAWVLVSGVVRLLLRKEPGCASFDRTAALTGVALATSLFIAWIPSGLAALMMVMGMNQEELAEMLSQPGLWQTFYLACYIVAAVGAAALLVLAARLSQRTAKGRGTAVGIAAAALLVGLFVLFIR
jgi:hypothetical protein